jgi:transketolase
MIKKSKPELEQIAYKVREHIIRMATDGGCFIGASLSCADLIVYLYSNYLNVLSKNLQDPERDYLFLSKGHDVPALYGTFAELGILQKERLKNHLKTNDHIYWHPNVKIPGIEFHSGSLGHLLSVAMGVAMDCKLHNQKNKIVVILGDGELNEGSIWEGFLLAPALKLNNLIAVVDRNHFQANMRTEELVPLESLRNKFESFGWQVHQCDGHNFDDLEKTFSNIRLNDETNNSGHVVIADTIRGKGLPSIEARADRWFANFSQEEIDQLLKELYSKEKTKLKSETLIVR